MRELKNQFLRGPESSPLLYWMIMYMLYMVGSGPIASSRNMLRLLKQG